MHGGSKGSPAELTARRREVESKASTALVKSGYAPVSDPVGELLDVAGQIVGVKDYLAEQVAQLTELATIDRQGSENVRAVLSAFERSLDRCANVLVRINRLGLEAKRVQIERDKINMVSEALKRAVYAGCDDDAGRVVLDAWATEYEALRAEDA